MRAVCWEGTGKIAVETVPDPAILNPRDAIVKVIERGEIDPSFIITYRIGLADAPEMYRTFRDKQDSCIAVVMTPGAGTARHLHAAAHP